ncbi:c-type cytochrome [Thiothrix lacustris]|uniref:c-type cytochrome n=1 Tax=Thiothrix lacustris TaxID=525917 RepID=UPI000491B5DB|nr:c-type cytochrome [Thiothrix lacustris]
MNLFNYSLSAVVGVVVLASSWAWANEAAQDAAAPQHWKPSSLRVALTAMPTGDVVRGKALNTQLMCASCHGENGIAPTRNWPHTAGQKADYTYKMLLDYQSGLRSEDERSKLMLAAVEPMSDQDMADVAAYYASLSAHEVAAKAEPHAEAEKLVRRGDPARLITPCASCHGVRGQGGKAAAPALAGQSEKAFIRTMTLYKSGERNNDVNKAMAQFAAKLTAEEIQQLAAYYHMR